jgi:hypothetical protein
VRRRNASSVELGRHGVLARPACRCGRCRAEERRRARLRYAEAASLAGREPSWRVSGRRAARHVEELLAGGATTADLAARAGVNVETVRRLLRGHRVLSSTAAALLALG